MTTTKKICTFLTKSIKADILKEVISDIELKMSVIKPYSYESAMVAFEAKVKKRNRDHPGHISRAGTSNINETSRKGKNTRDMFKCYNKRYNVASTSSGSVHRN